MAHPSGHSSSEAHEALRSAVLSPHGHLEDLLAEAGRAHVPAAEARRSRELADTFMATTSRHLAAVDDALLPAVRQHVPDGQDQIPPYLAQARELEQCLHAMKASLYGDANVRRLHGDTLWTDAGRLLTEHESVEARLVDGLATALSDEQLTEVAERFRHAEERAPTRPHAYTPHTGLLGRLVHRAWSVVDSFWDSAEGRVIPRRVRPPHPRRDSLLTRYMLGAPRFDDPERERRG